MRSTVKKYVVAVMAISSRSSRYFFFDRSYFLRLSLSFPFQPVVLEYWLLEVDIDRIGVPGQAAVGGELVETVEVGVERYDTSGPWDVLVYRELQPVVHVVVLYIVRLSGLCILQGYERAVVLSQSGIEVERRQKLRLI